MTHFYIPPFLCLSWLMIKLSTLEDRVDAGLVCPSGSRGVSSVMTDWRAGILTTGAEGRRELNQGVERKPVLE